MAARLQPRRRLAVGALCAMVCGPADALEFEIGDVPIKWDNLFTVGGMVRMQDRDPSLVGKSTEYMIEHPGAAAGLCLTRTSGTPDGGPGPKGSNSYSAGVVPGVCANGANNLAFVKARGSFSPNGDNGNVNFNKGDLVHASSKLTSDFTSTVYDFNFFVRTLAFFDARYIRYDLRHPDTTLEARTEPFSSDGKAQLGANFDVLDYNVKKVFTIGDRDISVKAGDQVLNWGESNFLFLNSLNTINPPDATRLRLPGFDLKELLRPVGMVVASGNVVPNLTMETFYEYKWKPLVVDPVGSFFSTSDTIGAGGRYAMLSFGKYPDDPNRVYEATDTCTPPGSPNCVDSAGALGSTTSRTILRDFSEEAKRKPRDGGQYGMALKYFADGLNNGTEFGLYAANYHSRIPEVSVIAADAGCLVTAADAACGQAPGAGPSQPLPLDTARIVVEYPSNIHLFGVSFNTTIGDYAWSGEYAYRPNLPVQIHTTDLVFAALQPALPPNDISLGATTIPGRRTALPDFVGQYRRPGCNTTSNAADRCIFPDQYIQGYDRLKEGQLGTTVLKLIGGDNLLQASQITLLLELGMTHVIDMPGKDKIQYNGAETNTHISHGNDGTQGIDPADVRANPPSAAQIALAGNPTTQHQDNFGTQYSYGYRFINLVRYDNALFGANVENLFGFFHDVKGVTPGLGGNFVEGRKQILEGIRFDFLSKWLGEVRYTWYTGGGDRDSLRDRDNLFVWLGYQF